MAWRASTRPRIWGAACTWTMAVDDVRNPMLAAPYTKLHCSQWNVDQAAGFVLCSTAAADRAGVPQDRRVYPRAFAESNHMLAVSKRAELALLADEVQPAQHVQPPASVVQRPVDGSPGEPARRAGRPMGSGNQENPEAERGGYKSAPFHGLRRFLQ